MHGRLRRQVYLMGRSYLIDQHRINHNYFARIPRLLLQRRLCLRPRTLDIPPSQDAILPPSDESVLPVAILVILHFDGLLTAEELAERAYATFP